MGARCFTYMKHLLTLCIQFIPVLLIAQAPDVSYECELNELVLTVENPNDTTVYWYSLTENNKLLDSGNVVSLNIKSNKTVAAIRGLDTTYLSLDKYIHGCHCQVYVPNTFTPDGDEFNETFKPIINCEVLAVNLFIYNRYGKELYFSTDLYPEWDGTSERIDGLAEAGLYVYLLYYVTEDNETHTENGFVQIMK